MGASTSLIHILLCGVLLFVCVSQCTLLVVFWTTVVLAVAPVVLPVRCG